MWVQGHAAVLRRLQQVLLQACAHLFVTATEFDHSLGLFEQSKHNLHKGAGGLGTLHIPNTLSAMLGTMRLLPASAGFSPCTALLMHTSPQGYGHWPSDGGR
jgi:hypothetical protein